MTTNLRAIPVGESYCTPPTTAAESFHLRQCPKTPAPQESRSEDAVEALGKWILLRGLQINIVGANPMLQELFLHLAGQKHTTVVSALTIRCSPNGEQRLQRPDDVISSQRTPARWLQGNLAEFVHYRQKF